MKYEEGMHIIFDVLKKGIFIEFRGLSHFLPGPFSNQQAGISAGERLCRELGWHANDNEANK